MTRGLEGLDDMLDRLDRLRKGGRAIAVAAMRGGLKPLVRACKNEAPGQIDLEIGSRVIPGSGNIVRGIVGLGVGKGADAPDPHGRFVSAGTKYIQAQHFISRAINGALDDAQDGMETAAAKKLTAIANKEATL